MEIADEKVVLIHYTLTDEAGETVDSSRGGEPLQYLHGVGNIIPGLEQALTGKSEGERLNVEVAPEHGYGERSDELVQKVPKAAFEGADEIEAGMRFRATGPDGDRLVTIAKVEEEVVTVDANHPLAGVTLNFDVEVVEVREASTEELEHGHVHGPDGHHH
jgi:FKBP-type peptidyl-prolyl cis-trans isomerase SlyD